MKISVIIPVFNGTNHISKAIESINNQTFKPYEVIVIDDGSTDNCAEIIKSYKDVIYCYQDNSGVASARNAGILLAKGDLISFLDHDDEYPSNKLEILHDQFLIEKNLMAAIGTVRYQFDNEQAKKGFTEIHEKEISTHVLIGAGLFKKELFDKIGFFDTKLLMADDFDWYERLYTSGVKIKKLNNCCLIYRKHNYNSTNDTSIAQRGLLLALRKSIARKKDKNA